MPGMKITLSAAMRARDVSMPGPEDMAEAEGTDQTASGEQGGTAKPEPGKRRGPRPKTGRPVPSAGPPGPLPGTSPPATQRQTAAVDPATPAPENSGQYQGGDGRSRRTGRRRSRTRRGR